MGVFAISYDFREDAGVAARRDSLVREIGRCERRWIGPSFALVETAEAIGELEARLYLESNLNSIKDHLLVIALADPAQAAGRGCLPEPDALRLLLPRISID